MVTEYFACLQSQWPIRNAKVYPTPNGQQNQRHGIGTHSPKLPRSRVNNLTLCFMLQCLDHFQYLSLLMHLCSVNIQSQLPSFESINKHWLFPFSHQFSKTGKCIRLTSCIYAGDPFHAHSSTMSVSAPENRSNPAFQPCRQVCRAIIKRFMHNNGFICFGWASWQATLALLMAAFLLILKQTNKPTPNNKQMYQIAVERKTINSNISL